jgi:putative DNA primase/helicase
MIVVPFRVTIEPGRQDPLLKEKLKEELPGILQWALEGLKRLRRRECFNVPAVCQQTLDDYQQESNPARVFLVEMCHSEPGASTMCSYLYQEYEVWSRDNGFEVLDARQFGKEVRRVYSTVERRRTSGHQRPWAYRGLSYGPRRPMRLSPLSFEEEIVGA